jgi:phospholipase C
MVVVTYDEFGGAWDHVPPPGQDGTQGPHDQWGPGTRIPAVIVSPWLRGNFVVDHTQYDTTSIDRTIEQRFGVSPLGSRDAAVNSLSEVFGAHHAPGAGGEGNGQGQGDQGDQGGSGSGDQGGNGKGRGGNGKATGRTPRSSRS